MPTESDRHIKQIQEDLKKVKNMVKQTNIKMFGGNIYYFAITTEYEYRVSEIINALIHHNERSDNFAIMKMDHVETKVEGKIVAGQDGYDAFGKILNAYMGDKSYKVEYYLLE
uniref:Uncharacterized protein n=1 Tax=Panagrolaimus sp. ES5 TaxID=591445 RepID=A0AC34G1P1_9BILA